MQAGLVGLEPDQGGVARARGRGAGAASFANGARRVGAVSRAPRTPSASIRAGTAGISSGASRASWCAGIKAASQARPDRAPGTGRARTVSMAGARRSVAPEVAVEALTVHGDGDQHAAVGGGWRPPGRPASKRAAGAEAGGAELVFGAGPGSLPGRRAGQRTAPWRPPARAGVVSVDSARPPMIPRPPSPPLRAVHAQNRTALEGTLSAWIFGRFGRPYVRHVDKRLAF